MHTIIVALYLCSVSFRVCVCAQKINLTPTRLQKTATAQPEGGPEEDVRTKASLTESSSYSWYSLEDISTWTQPLQQDVLLPTPRTLKDVSTASQTNPFPAPSGSAIHNPHQSPKAMHVLPSESQVDQSRLKPEGDKDAAASTPSPGHSGGDAAVWASWVSLDSSRSRVDTLVAPPPPVTTTLNGEREGGSSLLSPPPPLRHQDDQTLTAAEDQQVHRSHQAATGLQTTLSAQHTRSGGSTGRSLSAATAVSAPDQDVHQNETKVEIDLNLCWKHGRKIDISADRGRLGVFRTNSSEAFELNLGCSFRITGSPGTFLRVSFPTRIKYTNLIVNRCYTTDIHFMLLVIYVVKQSPPDLYSSTNCLDFSLISMVPFRSNNMLTFTSNPSPMALNVTFLTERHGVVTTPFFDGISTTYPPNLNVSTVITLPREYCSILVSFETFSLPCERECILFSEATNSTSHGIATDRVTVCGTDWLEHKIFNTSLKIEFRSVTRGLTALGFKMLFSFFTQENVPRFVRTGRYNCTSPNYELFKSHLECNLRE